jgi:hypothetical protein
LTTVVPVLARRLDLHDRRLRAVHQRLHQFVQRPPAAVQGLHQHRQVHARQHADPVRLRERGRDPGGRRAVDVGQHQDAAAVVDTGEQFARRGTGAFRVLVGNHVERGELRRHPPENVAGAVDQRRAQRLVRYDQDSDHGAK